MLRLVEVAEPAAETMTTGEYVPLALEWKLFAPPAPLYWRATPDDRSLIEVGLHPETGRICSISVILPGTNITLRDDVVPQTLREEQLGHPVCDLARWEKGWISDESIRFRILVDAHSASVWFGDSDTAEIDLRSGSVRFHVSAERQVVGFTVLDLPAADLARMRATLSWIRNNAGRTA